ncbi:ethanolamine utilization protein EutQ [Schizophyllum amplum]|uniref:Ethanolamine utilization protein EutQ n=1 Tax=Schizophyllum amplum TaxID=97359 RepID=A0A550C4M8_9AGAR|nr:ethanolamine utilization protein EutQ [Auriculariopsis ampla]TRM60945.1 ethanolamine utilization protein EutQ [Auriculariopsis ampla]
MSTDAKPIAFSVMKNVPKEFKPALLAPPNAYLEDMFSSDQVNPEKPMSSGLFRLEKGKELVYTYTYDEMKIILEGVWTISDETGQSVTAEPGDHFFFPKGTTITFKTDDYGLAFYVGQRKRGAA